MLLNTNIHPFVFRFFPVFVCHALINSRFFQPSLSLSGAEALAHRRTRLARCWLALGAIRAHQGDQEKAVAAFKRLFSANSGDYSTGILLYEVCENMIQPVSDGAFKHTWQVSGEGGGGGSMVLWYEFQTS